jgi:hypothetical protein
MITVTTMSSSLLVIVSLQWLLLAHVKFITASFLGNENLQTNITDEEQIYRVDILLRRYPREEKASYSHCFYLRGLSESGDKVLRAVN